MKRIITPSLAHRRWYSIAALLAATVCLIAVMIVINRADTSTASVMPALRGEEAVCYLKGQGLHSSLGEAMAAARYGVHWSEHTPWKDLPGAFYAGNPAQQMTAFFTGEGIHLESKSASDKKWRMEMKLTGLGYGERVLPVAPGDMKVTGNRIDIARALVSDQDEGQGTNDKGRITEWYVNRAEGIEQGFILALPPGERREGERLTLRLEVGGTVKARLVDEGRAVDLIAAGGERALSYDKLHVYDAAGRELEAGMRVQGGELWLDVDEREAVYPVTIDPMFSQQQQLIASDGAANDQFGFSVAISGETVVVGAALDHVGANAEQGSAYVFVRAGAVWSQQQKLTASDGEPNDAFGYSVAISGETIVVGAVLDDVGANADQGSAYVFERAGTVWSQQQKLTASDGEAGDVFGLSVAISGETIVVGAAFDNVGANAVQGSAYVFERAGTVWSQQQKLTASDGEPSDFFGYSVAISGETIVVGAVFNILQGSAYVFERAGTVWSQQQKLTASDGEPFDYFGYSVAISGGTIVVGARFDHVVVGAISNQGSAYVFERAGTVWSEQQRLLASDGAVDDEFGYSVAISGETIVVGAAFDDVGANTDQGSAYVFERAGTVWSQQQQLTASDGEAVDLFGYSVSISGETIVVGAFLDDVGANADQGSAYVFERAGTVWSLQQKLIASDGAANDQFGFSVAISGETAVVGAVTDNNQGSAYVFVRAGAVWSLQQKLIASGGAFDDQFGYSVSISGETIVVSSVGDEIGSNINQGSAYVFTRAGTVWSLQQRLIASDGATGDNFAISVAISGETIVVGSVGDEIGPNSNQGSAYVFERAGTVWSLQQKLTASDGEAGDVLGYSVAISGGTIVVGSAGDDVAANVDQGSAYVFERAGTVWGEQQKLIPFDGEASNSFGFSVAISGETLVVGAFLDDVAANADQGSAYVFERAGTVWSLQQKLTASDGGDQDQFGRSVAISGETIVVGALLDDVAANTDQGSAYVFERAGTVWGDQQKLTASDGAVGDQFGISVAISGGTIVVGASFDDVGANADQGSAYIFTTLTPPTNTPPMITASPVTLQQGQVITGASIATVSDNEDAASTLAVTVVSGGTGTGITLTDIANSGGAITADVAASCTATSGTVGLRVTDSGGLFAEATLNVTVTPETTPPTITCPSNVTQGTDPNQCSAVVTYPNATATDNCPGVGTPVCTPASGSTFPIGTTSVTCTVTDSANLTSACSFTVTVTAAQLTALGPAKVWIGLKNSDDVGTKFDLLAEVMRNGVVIGSGQLNAVPGGSSGFNNAILNTIDLALSSPSDFCSGDTLRLRLSVRVAASSGHVSGTARLWYNDSVANSRFTATVGGTTADYFLLNGFTLGTSAGPGPKKTIDVFVNRNVGGNPFKPFGTWTKTF